jgi:hypothetical protein
MHCHACDAEIGLSGGDRIGFSDGCEACGADLHTCLNCLHHDASAYNECRESSAERVADRVRGNRCEYFTPGEGRGGAGARARSAALDDLEGLFKK